MSFVASLYVQLLAVQELPIQVQRRAFQLFQLEGHESGLAQLAAHPSLDPELDAALASIKSVKVRAQWASRPGRSIEELKEAFSKEKRVTMLEIGAQLKGMPDEWYLQMMRTPSAKVAYHIVTNTEIGLAVRKKAATIHASASTEYRSMQSQLSVVYSGHPELHDALATGGRHSLEIMRYVAGSPLSLQNQRAVLEKAVYAEFVAPATHRYGQYETNRQVSYALATAMAFARQPAYDKTLREELLVRTAGYDMSGFETSYQDKRTELIEMLKSDPAEVQDSMAIASSTEDLSTLADLVEQAISERDYDLGTAAASNKNITEALLSRVLTYVHYGSRRELLKCHKGNAGLFVVLIREVYAYGDDVIEIADDPSAVLELYLKALGDDDRSVPGWVMESKYMKLEMLERIPFHTLAQADLSEQLRSQLVDLITNSLGESSSEAWTLFESVANSSGASLGDVIAATTSLSQ
jgi:hypothetical protein